MENGYKKELISIIVPMYNQISYISECIESLLKQTYSEFELIIVDDGSSDGSERICDEYAAKDSRVLVYHKNNSGVSCSRNYGLERLQGEWFCFVDADDYVAPNYLEVLYENAIRNQCSISACSYKRTPSRNVIEQVQKNGIQIIESPEACIHNFICSSAYSMNGMVWNKLYRSSEYKSIQFCTDLKVNEDCLYTFEVMKKCKRACMTINELYYWYFRDDSACHSKPKSLDLSAADVNMQLLRDTAYMNDDAVSEKLKTNYVKSVLRVLVYVKYSAKDDSIKSVVESLKRFKKQVWKKLSTKERLAFYLILYCPNLLSVIRRVM